MCRIRTLVGNEKGNGLLVNNASRKSKRNVFSGNERSLICDPNMVDSLFTWKLDTERQCVNEHASPQKLPEKVRLKDLVSWCTYMKQSKKNTSRLTVVLLLWCAVKLGNMELISTSKSDPLWASDLCGPQTYSDLLTSDLLASDLLGQLRDAFYWKAVLEGSTGRQYWQYWQYWKAVLRKVDGLKKFPILDCCGDISTSVKRFR